MLSNSCHADVVALPKGPAIISLLGLLNKNDIQEENVPKTEEFCVSFVTFILSMITGFPTSGDCLGRFFVKHPLNKATTA